MFKRWLTLGGGLMAAGALLAAPAQAAPTAPTQAAVTRPPLQKITDVKGLQYQLTEKYDSPMSPPPGYEQVGIDGALSGDDRVALTKVGDSACPKSVTDNLPRMAIARGFCWDKEMQGAPGDVSTQPWVPQGIATSGESRAGGVLGNGKQAVVASWNWQNDDPNDVQHPTSEGLDYRNNSVKLAFADLTDSKYRWVLPVWDDGTGNLRRVYGHGGGLAWYGKYLFMANTSNWNHQTVPPGDAGKGAVRVFDTTKIYRRLDGRTGDFQYVMPEVRRYTTGFQPAYVSLDRNSTGGASLIAGTYEWSKDSVAGTRIVRYDFLDDDYRLASVATEGWVSTATTDKANAISDVQGVQANGDTLYINMSGGWVNPPTVNNRLAVVNVHGDPSTWTIRTRTDWAEHPEDLAPWYEPGSPYQVKEIWGLTEAEGQRAFFAVDPTLLNG